MAPFGIHARSVLSIDNDATEETKKRNNTYFCIDNITITRVQNKESIMIKIEFVCMFWTENRKGKETWLHHVRTKGLHLYFLSANTRSRHAINNSKKGDWIDTSSRAFHSALILLKRKPRAILFNLYFNLNEILSP